MIVEDIEMDGFRHHRLKCREKLFYALDDFNCIGTGLPHDRKNNAGSIVVPTRHLIVLNTIYYLSHIFDAHRRTIAISDNYRLVGFGIEQLTVSLHGEGLKITVESTGRHIDVSRA